MTETKRVFVTGASGFVGNRLIRALTDHHCEVRTVSRSPRLDEPGVRRLRADPTVFGDWLREVNGCDAVVNLAGEPIIGKRWSPEQKKTILDSRVKTTQNLVEAVNRAVERPAVFVSASAVGYYPKNEETAFDESGPSGDDFLSEVCARWEAAARLIEGFGIRLVILRIGVALGTEGGALSKMLTPFKLGVGGPLGGGEQWFPWIHIDDVIGLIEFCIENEAIKGVVNATAPNPVRMKEFSSELGRALHRPAFLPVPSFVVQVAFGEASSAVLDGQKIVPAAALNAGYTFRFPKLDAALKDLVG